MLHVWGRGEVYRVLVVKDAMRTFGKFKTWEDNIKMDLQEMGMGGQTYWIDLALDRNNW
jgi:hypothetical protein